MIDTMWQVTAATSLLVSVPLGLLARRGISRLDQRRRHGADR